MLSEFLFRQGGFFLLSAFVGFCVYLRGLVIFYRCGNTRHRAPAKRGFQWCLAGASLMVLAVAISSFMGSYISTNPRDKIVYAQVAPQAKSQNDFVVTPGESATQTQYNTHGSFD